MVGRSVVASCVEVTTPRCVGLEVEVVVVWARPSLPGRVVVVAVAAVDECNVHECMERNWLSNYSVSQEATIVSGKN